MSSWASSAGLVRTAPNEYFGRFAWVVAVLLAALGFSGWGWATMWGLPCAAFAIGGVTLLATGVGHRRTPAGRIVWSQAGGFERLLSTPSAEDRFDFAARKDLFIAYVPYAVAFGVADRWAEKYRVSTQSEPPIPGWYPYDVDRSTATSTQPPSSTRSTPRCPSRSRRTPPHSRPPRAGAAAGSVAAAAGAAAVRGDS